MKFSHLAGAALSALLITLNADPVCAQTPVDSQSSANPVSPQGSNQLARYTAAHDSLMRLVTNVHAEAEARLSFFKNAYGSLGGLHRRIWSYSSRPSSAVNSDGQSTGKFGLVKKQIIKQRFGIELESVVYYDAQRRVVLKERYEDHRLVRLELFEYKTTVNSYAASWLFLRGNYVRHLVAPNSLAFKNTRRDSYFFKPLPTGE